MTRTHLTWPLLLAGLLVGCAQDVDTELSAEDLARQPDRFHATELLLDLEDGTDLTDFVKKYPLLADAHWNSPNVADEAIAVADVPPELHEALLAKLRADPRVESANRNGLMRLPGNELLSSDESKHIPDDDSHDPLKGFPNDPLYGLQWNMELVGARGAWRYATGEDVVVAVIDTGVAYEDTSGKGLFAPDLKSTKFVNGYDFVNDDEVAADDHGHGTHCAGTIAQSTNNGRGVIGLAPHAKIMPLKVLTAQGWGTVSDIVDAIRFAADNGADVISMSLGGGGFSKEMNAACKYARDKGVAVVCAAGNTGRGRVEFPAAYEASLAVSSVGPTKKRAFYSSYGKGLFIAAPGGDMRKSVKDGVLQNALDLSNRQDPKTVYAYYQGTSMATPHVAAACALLRQAGVTRVDAMETILAITADGGDWNKEYGHGVLNAGAAVRHAIFAPATVALVLGGLFCLGAVRMTRGRTFSLGLLACGALAGSAGLFFLRPFGLGEIPVVGEFLTRGLPEWDIAILGASWHWNALFASALFPVLIGIVSIPSKLTRSIGVGIMLGWAARLIVGVIFPYADVQFIPGQGLLDGAWLLANAAAILLAVAVVVRLGRGRNAGPGRASP